MNWKKKIRKIIYRSLKEKVSDEGKRSDESKLFQGPCPSFLWTSCQRNPAVIFHYTLDISKIARESKKTLISSNAPQVTIGSTSLASELSQPSPIEETKNYSLEKRYNTFYLPAPNPDGHIFVNNLSVIFLPENCESVSHDKVAVLHVIGPKAYWNFLAGMASFARPVEDMGENSYLGGLLEGTIPNPVESYERQIKLPTLWQMVLLWKSFNVTWQCVELHEGDLYCIGPMTFHFSTLFKMYSGLSWKDTSSPLAFLPAILQMHRNVNTCCFIEDQEAASECRKHID